jgi:Rieske Fe-S protein
MDEGRRRLLTVVACGAGAATAGVAAVPAAGLVVGAADANGPGRAAQGDGWTRLGRLDELPEGRPVQRPIVGAEGDAWTVAPQRQLGAVFLLREGNTVRSWSAICPHVGCLVEWDDARYICRCHDSAFARDGASRDLAAVSGELGAYQLKAAREMLGAESPVGPKALKRNA